MSGQARAAPVADPPGLRLRGSRRRVGLCACQVCGAPESGGVIVDRELARDVNLHIHRVARLLGDPVAYRCECGSPACEAQVEVAAVAFAEALRTDGV